LLKIIRDIHDRRFWSATCRRPSRLDEPSHVRRIGFSVSKTTVQRSASSRPSISRPQSHSAMNFRQHSLAAQTLSSSEGALPKLEQSGNRKRFRPGDEANGDRSGVGVEKRARPESRNRQVMNPRFHQRRRALASSRVGDEGSFIMSGASSLAPPAPVMTEPWRQRPNSKGNRD